MPIRSFFNETGNFASRKPKETAMRFEMFVVDNYHAWGELVKSWVKDPKSRPGNIDEFRAQVKQADPGGSIPTTYTDLELIPTSSADTILRIRLPPLDLLKASEDALKTDQYDLPDFYKLLMYNSNLKDDTPPPDVPPPEGGRMVFHNNRVGEYTVKFCG
jgi:hypothetical protein